ncbi:hypothetical protein [Sporosarcina cyprini]|uniref:hypothetical protein n=1 Tax=Sporosarcina cyprini TaxID=2910523 RepID=UPI001EDDE283|nr:hypothetical protein [Sporosarcina cyprini]MCG3088051.1 hypothetical protein [Sporosarcina cyprini]
MLIELKREKSKEQLLFFGFFFVYSSEVTFRMEMVAGYERLYKDTRGSKYYTSGYRGYSSGSKKDTSGYKIIRAVTWIIRVVRKRIRAVTKLYERLPGSFEWFVKEDTEENQLNTIS